METTTGTRWSGADWADQSRNIILIGAGGIGSWTALALARIGHQTIYVCDEDMVDETNVAGGQMYLRSQVGTRKSNAVVELCRQFGCTNYMSAMNHYTPSTGTVHHMICAVDNMEARKAGFKAWKQSYGNNPKACFIDGRLLIETMEVFCIQGNNKEQIERYENEHLFDDSEVEDLDCTAKQTTFSAMTIAGLITGTLCNFLTNVKLAMDFREVPFYQRFHFPIMEYKTDNLSKEEVIYAAT